MSRASEHEQVLRIGDLESALKMIGQLLANEGLAPKKRIDMALGILWRYDAAPKEAQS